MSIINSDKRYSALIPTKIETTMYSVHSTHALFCYRISSLLCNKEMSPHSQLQFIIKFNSNSICYTKLHTYLL